MKRMKSVFISLLVLTLMLTCCFVPATAQAGGIQGPSDTRVSVSNRTVKVTWNKVPLATSYEMEVYTEANYQRMVKENGAVPRYQNKIYGITGTSKTLTLTPGSYVIQVAAINRSAWGFGKAVHFTVSGTQTKWLQGVPNWKQTDRRWSSVKIGTKTIGQVGCTLTCLSMTESYRLKKTITPGEMRNRQRFSNNDMYWPSNYYTLSGSLNLKLIYQTLQAGKPVIVGAQKVGGGWHWVTVVGYGQADPARLTASMFYINDPNSSSRTNLQQFLNVYSRVGCMKTYR